MLTALDGVEVGVDLPENWSEKRELLPLDGLEMAGESALRNSVYAMGGVMGVFKSSSRLMTLSNAEAGLRGSSDGSVAERGVFKAAESADRVVLAVGRVGVRMVGVINAGNVGLGDVEGMATMEGVLRMVRSSASTAGRISCWLVCDANK